MADDPARLQIYESTIHIEAPPDSVWRVWLDVERWPEWTASMTSVELLDGATSLAVGTRVKVRQPQLPVTVWTVTELDPGHRFSWSSSAPGVSSVATHEVVPDGNGSRAVARIEQGGVLRRLVRLLMGGLVKRYLELEGAGLKARSEE